MSSWPNVPGAELIVEAECSWQKVIKGRVVLACLWLCRIFRRFSEVRVGACQLAPHVLRVCNVVLHRSGHEWFLTAGRALPSWAMELRAKLSDVCSSCARCGVIREALNPCVHTQRLGFVCIDITVRLRPDVGDAMVNWTLTIVCGWGFLVLGYYGIFSASKVLIGTSSSVHFHTHTLLKCAVLLLYYKYYWYSSYCVYS